MKNTVTATIEFYFKGNKFSPSITIELDPHLHSGGGWPNLYPVIASQNNIDLYSYEYEMMLSETPVFSDATGLVADFIINGMLDIQAFENAWQENNILVKLLEIAQQHMDITDFQQNPALKQALLDAYATGLQQNKISAE